MRSILFTGFGLSMFEERLQNLSWMFDIIRDMNYLQLLLLFYGIFAIKHILAGVLFNNNRVFTCSFLWRSAKIFGIGLGAPLSASYIFDFPFL